MGAELDEQVARLTADRAAAVTEAVRRAARAAPALAERLQAAGIDPADIAGLDELDQLPVLTKDELTEHQHRSPPWGGLLAADARPVRLFQSPGPIYEPQLPGEDPWGWGQALDALGVGGGDTVINCFNYHLSPAGIMMDQAVRSRGAAVVPGGVGNLELQARAVADLGVTGYIGLPSYLKALIERFEQEGHPRHRWRVRRALVTAEPLPDSLRDWLGPWLGAVHMAYGTAETGLLAYETAPGSGLRLASGVLVEVCDPNTDLPVAAGEIGQVVVTLPRPDYPLVRFGTGDLSAWRAGPNGEVRLAGVLGRVGEAVKVRGMFLHPRQAEAALADLPGLAARRFVVRRRDHRDVLQCEVVAARGADPTELAHVVRDRVRSALRFDVEVTPVASITPDAPVIDDQREWD